MHVEDGVQLLDAAARDLRSHEAKLGPIDFQVREPVSPLFAGLRRTNEASYKNLIEKLGIRR